MEILYDILKFSLIIYCSTASKESMIIVKTDVGGFIGVSRAVSSLFKNETRSVSRFVGIPYAKPPVGNLRFSKPVPYGMVKSLYNATYFRPHCIQTYDCYDYILENDYMQSEDCLYLNIYKPGRHLNYGKKFSVMVYIHGGGYDCGGADIYNGERLSAFRDVIVVVINYRLNIFGFLSDESSMLGNYGLWDMKLALQWIHDNIAAFKGNKNAVTIFGNSAGGAAVLYQATNPANRGLFQRVIAQSGSILAWWSYKRNQGDKFREIVLKTNCQRNTSVEIMQCLRSVPAVDLKTNYSLTYLPTVDGDFVKDIPLSLLNAKTKSGNDALTFLSELDLIIGVTNQDGALGSNFWNIISEMALMPLFRHLYVKKRLEYVCEHFQERDVRDILNLYFIDAVIDNHDGVRGRFVDMATDIALFVPAVLMANLYRQSVRKNGNSSNIYFYIFVQKPDFAEIPHWLSGATHFMEVPYVFGLPRSFHEKLTLDFGSVYPTNISLGDITLSETMMTLWSNFAKTG